MSKSLDMGCGRNPRNPFGADELYGVDVATDLGPNVRQADLAIGPIPFDDESFEFMSEVWRVLKMGGYFVSSTPCYPHQEAFMDPTHVNIITEMTFRAYFDHVNRWGATYGFNGAFAILQHEVRGSHLFCVMQKVAVPPPKPAGVPEAVLTAPPI